MLTAAKEQECGERRGVNNDQLSVEEVVLKTDGGVMMSVGGNGPSGTGVGEDSGSSGCFSSGVSPLGSGSGKSQGRGIIAAGIIHVAAQTTPLPLSFFSIIDH